MKQTKTEKALIETMKEAGLYEDRYLWQIQDTAAIIDNIATLRAKVKREGYTLQELKDKGIGYKTIAHPLLAVINSSSRELRNHLASLGLNKQSEKKAEASNDNKEDKMADFLNSLNK